jgi:hypothetical protein
MDLMKYAETQDPKDFCIAWCEDAKSFVIRDPDTFTRHVVPKFFKGTKFSSFTRKLYRWGFRQINRGIGPDDPIIFGNECFQKEDRALIAKMRSVTAAGTRKNENGRMVGSKRGFEESFDEDHKRMLFNQLLHQQKHMNIMSSHSPPQYYNPNGSVSLNNALRPGPGSSAGMGGQYQMNNRSQSGMLMNSNGQHGNMNMMMNQYMPNPMAGPYGNGQQYPDARSTAEIVNAAIAALRHAN